MDIVIPEAVSISIYRYGYFEEGLTKMILKYLKPGMTFFDIGAHFGYFTLLASAIVGNEGQVHSFEPTPSTFNILRINASDKNNVLLNNCAVFSSRKTLSITDLGDRYSSSNSIYDPRLPQDILSRLKVKKYEIEAISVDNYLEINRIIPNFIKIDAESAEFEILRGMDKTIDNFRPIISIEIGDEGVKGVPVSKELIIYLMNRGYQAYKYDDGRILRHYPVDEQYKSDNILFLPS